MKSADPVLSWQEARQQVLLQTRPLSAETVELSSALGRVLAQEVRAKRPLPPWDNSAMDGYAVRAAEVSPQTPLQVQATIAAGHPLTEPLLPGAALRIMTGAPLPSGADTVIMREEATEHDGLVRFAKKPRLGQHVRRLGEDVAQSALVLKKGAVIGPGEIGLLAALGKLLVDVHRRPTVAIVSTGDELRTADETPQIGQIVNSNAPCLQALVHQSGGQSRVFPIVSDKPEELTAVFREALSADVVLSSGGVSVGDFDFVRQALSTVGVKQHFGRVAMKPGKPLVFSTFDAEKRTLLFGLPGNPASALVSFVLFVYPALRCLLGFGPENAAYPVASVLLNAKLVPDRERTHFLRAQVTRSREKPDQLWAVPLARQGSGMLSSLCGMNALLEVPPGDGPLQAGSCVLANLLSMV